MRVVSVAPIRHALVSYLLVACFAGSTLAQAQQAAVTPIDQNEVNRQLMQRLQELEDEVKQLKAQLAPAVPATAILAVAAEQPAPAPAAPAVAAAEVNEVAPRLHLEVFGDVGAQKYSHLPDTFLFGSLDLFMTARLSDKVSALGEALFIAQSGNNVQVDVERLILTYRHNEHLIVSAGRYHSWVGYYNTAFNKAAFLETTVDRPFIFQFDDTGGVLPMQEVGANVTGKIPSGKIRLGYVIEFGNGRAWGLNTQPAQNNQDANNSKSVNGGLFVRPAKLPGLQLGFSLRYDNLTVPGPAVAETIATTHAIFNNGTYEILNEGVFVRHAVAGGHLFETAAFYTQFSRSFKAFRPYFRYQYFNAPSNDPVYAYASINAYAPPSVTSFLGRFNGPSAGLRYNFTENSAVKLQYDRYSLRGLPSENGLSTQIAFSF
jgi:hypothetical protein